jgi:UDP-N-acetylglucosamine 4-epimerase
MSAYEELGARLRREPKAWLVTGVAGFIGSHLLEALLKLDQRVVGLDNFSTGKRRNLEQVKELVNAQQWERFQCIEGDIIDLATCSRACKGVDFVLHEAALGSVPLSMTEPLRCHASNVTGFLNLLVAARDARARRVIYASSSAVYGDDPLLPKVEDQLGKPLSPYAASKVMDENYAGVFAGAYGLASIGLRYFNVFGPRQDPEGAYAAVIPKWLSALLRREPVRIHGTGETSRDFCFVENIVQSNLLAATTQNPEALNQIYNIGLGQKTTLNELFEILQGILQRRFPDLPQQRPIYDDFRPGDVLHSLADIHKAQQRLGYAPTRSLEQGLDLAMDWYCANLD